MDPSGNLPEENTSGGQSALEMAPLFILIERKQLFSRYHIVLEIINISVSFVGFSSPGQPSPIEC